MTMHEQANCVLSRAANALRWAPGAKTLKNLDHLLSILDECDAEMLEASNAYVVADYGIELHPLHGSIRALEAIRATIFHFRHPMVMALCDEALRA